MILLLAGTKDGRQLAEDLQEKGYSLLATAVSSYGGQLLLESGLEEIMVKGLTSDDLEKLIKEKGIKAIIDATHPFAQVVSRQAIEVAQRLEIPYLRFERMKTAIPANPLIHKVNTIEEAADKAVALGKNIFLTTGSKNLDVFLSRQKEGQPRMIARVLPDPMVLKKCFDLGLTPQNIVALQGPFSKQLNKALFEQYDVDVVVSKESGLTGGVDCKLEAALELGIPLVLVQRPVVSYPYLSATLAEVEVFLHEKLLSN